jgi:hypothetical protein
MQTSLAVRRAGLWVALFAADALLGWMNYHATDDVQPVAAGLIAAGFAFTFARPRLTWAIVSLLWLAIPVSSVAGFITNYHPGPVKPAPLYETLIAVIFPAVGAAIGLGARRIFRSSGAAAPRA